MKKDKLFKELKTISIIFIVIYLFIFISSIILYNVINWFIGISLLTLTILFITLHKKMIIAPILSIVISIIYLILNILIKDIVSVILYGALLYDSIGLYNAIRKKI